MTNNFPLSTNVEIGEQIYDLIVELYPICRSLTGDGVRETLSRIEERIPLDIYEVPSGTPVLDWTVPKEWNVRDGYVRGPREDLIVDFRRSSLHVLGYSIPIEGRFQLNELKEHLFTDPEHPDWIPFRYSYYDENWGFCLPHRQLEQLEDGEYEVMIDSTLEDGSLTYAECYIPGASTDEVLICVHIDHPGMCNDNLSGVAVATFLAERLARAERRLSYRFLFIPTTIGSITWLSRNEQNLERVKHGLVLVCIGDAGGFTYKQSRRGNTEIDRVMNYVLQQSQETHKVVEFSPFGFDERQFCSPGFNLPVGSLSRSANGKYPQYHTSADNLELMIPEKLAASLELCESAIEILEGNVKYLNVNPKGEPQLGKSGIYRKVGGAIPERSLVTMFWVLNYSDGEHSLLDIAEQSGTPFREVRQAADLLFEHDLLVPCEADAIGASKATSNGNRHSSIAIKASP
jgi:aminopeptidase-like protein